MEKQTSTTVVKYTIGTEHLKKLYDALSKKGYTVIGPTVRDGAIIYDRLESAQDLPSGHTETRDPATYRLEKRKDGKVFGFTVGQHSWKQFLHPSNINLWEGKRKGSSFQKTSGNGEFPKYAFFGVRPCDVSAIAIQDKIFTGGDYVDATYNMLRKDALIVAINCTDPSGTCFCASVGTGPKAKEGYDIALTEVIDQKRHFFVLEAGSKLGAQILKDASLDKAGDDDAQAADALLEIASGKMGRNIDTCGIKELLYYNHEHPRWDDVADRCMTCGNCTMVCPTCFCNTLYDATDLTGGAASRTRKWDSCQTLDFAYIHGGSTRPSPRARYRQWLTHKFASWQDQFGMIGCVGCGRCITWCPVGIDVTEEISAIQGIQLICETCVVSKDRSLETMKRILVEHPFIKMLGDKYLEFMAEAASIVRFNPGEFIFRTGGEADRFYLIRHGNVAIETFVPERGAIIVQTLGEGDILGWSWMIPPHQWLFDAEAVELTRAVSIDGHVIKEKCERDPEFGYLVAQYFAQIIGQRMDATRMQFLDIYGDHV